MSQQRAYLSIVARYLGMYLQYAYAYGMSEDEWRISQRPEETKWSQGRTAYSALL